MLRAVLVRRNRQAFASLTSALHNRSICRLELAWGVAIAAEWAHFVALGVFAYDHGGASFVGLAGLVRLLPAGLVAPFASSLGDRVRRDRLLRALIVLEAGTLFGSGVAAAVSARIAVLALAAVVGVTSTLVRPMVQSILPSLARTSTELVASNGATSTFEGLGALVGPLVAGSAIVLVGSSGIFTGAGAALLIAVGILAEIRVPRRSDLIGPDSTPPGTDAGPSKAGPVGSALTDLGLIVGDRRLRLLFGLAAAQGFVRGCLNVLVVVAAFGVLHAGSSGVGYLNAGLGVGGLIGAFGATTLSTRRLALGFGLALVFWGLPISAIGGLSSLGLAILCLVVVGAANSVEDVAVITLIQRSSADEMLSGVLGALWGAAMTAVALGSIVTPAIVTAVGIRSALVLVGLILPMLVLLSGRRLLRIDAMFKPVEALDLIDAVPMFAPISLAIKERMATLLSPITLAAGETIIRAGEPGDRVYIIKAGRLAIERRGKQIATASQGDCIGEIALLESVPRTASVRAEVDSALYALGRQAFLASIMGSSGAKAEASRIAAERLADLGRRRARKPARARSLPDA
jgi:CRP-like cAMP-binding protein